MSTPISLPRAEQIEVRPILDDDRPMVELEWAGHVLRMDVRYAEQFAMSILRASRAAEMDKFLFDWMCASDYFRPQDATFLLEQFDAWRLEHLLGKRNGGA